MDFTRGCAKALKQKPPNREINEVSLVKLMSLLRIKTLYSRDDNTVYFLHSALVLVADGSAFLIELQPIESDRAC